MSETLEQVMERGDVSRYLREETVLVHHGTFTGNTCEARVIVTFDLPDGRVMACNKIVKLRFKRLRSES